MNRSLMNKDLHSPAFIRASVPADKEEPLQVASKTTLSNGIKWSRIIRLTLLMGILLGGVYLLSKLVTAQVVTALLIVIAFVVLRSSFVPFCKSYLRFYATSFGLLF